MGWGWGGGGVPPCQTVSNELKRLFLEMEKQTFRTQVKPLASGGGLSNVGVVKAANQLTTFDL